MVRVVLEVRGRRLAKILVGLTTAVTVIGCTALADPTPAPSASPTPAPTATISTVPSSAAGQLAALRVIERHPIGVPTYERRAFGSSWSDVDGNGCNQRDDVLLRDARPGTVRVQQQRSCTHDVLAGTWPDPYTGKTLQFDNLKDRSQAQAIQIDHVVPLAEAWVSGASTWPPERRKLFANNLAHLLAVDGPANAAKGADDPASWRPKKSYQCSYATRWISVKHRWGLGADPSEITALRDMLSTCGR